MIIFDSGGNKNLILIILVVLFTGIIAWQWALSDPFASVEMENNFLSKISEDTGDSVDNIKNSVAQGIADAKVVSDEKESTSADEDTSASSVLEEGDVQLEKGKSNLAGQASGFVGSFVNLGWLWVTLAIVVLIGWMSSLAYHRKSLKGKR